jgi:hypothetical protein
MTMVRRLLLPFALAVACACTAVPASARIPIRVGIGDQQVSTFDSPAFQRAGFRRVRYIVPWNVMRDDGARLKARAYVQRAREEGFQVLLHVSTDDYAIKRGHLPSVSEYHTNITRLVRYFRGLGVRDFGVWDEANHASQPTYDSPSHAALFFVQMYRAVKGGCSTCGVVALDVLDQTGVERYMRDFYRRLSPTYRRRATVVGIHNYGDVNRRRTTFTRAIIQEAHHYNSHTRFWLTETGGIVRFGANFPYSPARAASRLSEMFSIANRYRHSGIQRMYVYQWTGAQRDDRFDAGLTNPDGSVRPGYAYLREKLSGYER